MEDGNEQSLLQAGSLKKGRPFTSKVFENVSERDISTKHSMFRQFKNFIKKRLEFDRCRIFLPGLLDPKLSFQENLLQAVPEMSKKLRHLAKAAISVHVC